MPRATVALVALFVSASFCHAQDSQSLGDIARQARAQKQQRDAQTKDLSPDSAGDAQGQDSNISYQAGTRTSRVITNDDSPSRQEVTPAAWEESGGALTERADSAAKHEALGEHWKSRILMQKQMVTSLQSEISQLSSSIRYAGATCRANCVKWNEHQERKQEQFESMKAQLEIQTRRLEEMQETARKQGFGNAVYDP